MKIQMGLILAALGIKLGSKPNLFNCVFLGVYINLFELAFPYLDLRIVDQE